MTFGHDIIVVGGGISGLSFARLAAENGKKVILVEKESRVGGCFRSFSARDGIWGELGAHTAYNSYGNFLTLMEVIGAFDLIQKRRKASFKIWDGERVRSVMSRMNLWDLVNSIMRIFSYEKRDRSVELYFSTILGSKNFQNLFRPAFNAVLSQESSSFPAKMLFKKRPRRKDVIKKFSIKGGFEELAKEIAQHPNIEIKKSEVQNVFFEKGFYKVDLDDDTTIQAPAFAVATSPLSASKIFHESFRELSLLFENVKTVTVESLGIIVSKNKVKLPKVAGLIPIKEDFHSVVSSDVLPADGCRSFTFHFKPGKLPFEKKQEVIERVLGISWDDTIFHEEKITELPSPASDQGAIVGDIDTLIRNSGIFVLGNYFEGLAIEDCVTRSFEEYKRFKRFSDKSK